MQSQISNPVNLLIFFFVLWQVVYKYSDKSFINKPTFFNIVPQLFKKTYRVGTTWFYRFACMIVVQAHISLMTRLCGIVWQPSIFKGFTSILESLQIPIAACLRFRSETSFKIPDIWHCYICCICYDLDYWLFYVEGFDLDYLLFYVEGFDWHFWQSTTFCTISC